MFNARKQRKIAAEDAPVAAKPAVNPNAGFIDLKKVLQQLHEIARDPTGKDVEVDSSSKQGVHTFTIKVKPTEMMQRAEENGAVATEAVEAPVSPPPAEAMPVASSKGKFMRTADAKASSLSRYPESFLKSIGF